MDATGNRLGPYDILSPIGAGGMGEVYRARDSRLGRHVAIKVLPAALAADGDRLRRFEVEARSASALSHPNIVAVYDVGTTDGVSWIAMEFVAGQTLRSMIDAGPLPGRKLLSVAAQIADGLAKAHAVGIVHRDLKPENVMITSDGIVKILDFGLAKLAGPDGDLTQAAPASPLTAAGTVLGTVGYMSPEQARGEATDHRSDQFALGSILYEMISGRRAFARRSAPETLTAIIREEPAPLTAVAPHISSPLRWIVERCLAKDPAGRYDSTRDLAHDLIRLRDANSEAGVSHRSRGRGSRRSRRKTAVVTIALAGAVIAGAAAGIIWRPRRTSVPRYQPVTFHRGSIGLGRFAADGNTILYSAAWQGQPVRLYSTRLDSTESTSLPLPSAHLLSVSSGGKLAILLSAKDKKPTVAEVALAGGAPRDLVETEPFEATEFARTIADWLPGQDKLAIVKNGQLEFPSGNVLVAGSSETPIQEARFSPDGRQIAFIQSHDVGGWAVGVVDLSGKKRVLSEGWEFILGLAWHPVTGEVWFSARAQGISRTVVELHAVSTSGVHRLVAATPQLLIVQDIAPDGRLLARSDEWPNTMMCLPPGATNEIDLTWLDFSEVRALSDDGKDLVFVEGGAAEGSRGGVYTRKTDGSSPAVRLGDGEDAQALSADKRWIVQRRPDRLVVLPVGAGQPMIIQDRDFTYARAQWFHDGKRLLVDAAERGHGRRVYVRDLATGVPRPVTPEGFVGSHLSLDDQVFVALDANTGERALFPVVGGPSRPLPGLLANEGILNFAADGKSLFVASPELPMRVDRYELASAKRTPFRQITLSDATGVDSIDSVSMTPDGAYCYSFMRSLARLYVVDGLR